MPIYEFYCPDCHMIFNFLSTKVNIDKRPACPRCKRPELERKFSRFSIFKGLEEPSEDGLPDLDESKLSEAMSILESEAGSLDEDNPKQAAQVMRKLFKKSGLEMGPGMEEAMRRMEAGEDPEQIEEEMGDALEGDELFTAKKKAMRKALLPPDVDETIYDL